MYVLQLSRANAVEGDVAKDYAAAVARARQRRATRLLKDLTSIAHNAHELGSFSTLRKAIDWNSPRAVAEVNHFFAQLRDFAGAANLAVEGTEGLEPVRRIDAFRELSASGTARARELTASGMATAREAAGAASSVRRKLVNPSARLGEQPEARSKGPPAARSRAWRRA